jgi:hypothetical protein
MPGERKHLQGHHTQHGMHALYRASL